jgi:hypothetical protein
MIEAQRHFDVPWTSVDIIKIIDSNVKRSEKFRDDFKPMQPFVAPATKGCMGFLRSATRRSEAEAALKNRGPVAL